ncbi:MULTISPECIES: hypothetical protein [unclassified Photobacterium]|uniref:hypothetical protein n=1 Tax=unclassified Photobacterium TaxID=2628852 RepID=UPI000D153825|nr:MULTISPECIES: hypothetical protein [unclassified Photobacterium]PSV29490.1 hypothetical protein C9J40_17220 [Photobacterium sp. GB-72]PSV35828.1 hypothetical protein C9J38_14440 [Photobacterium sp. GB-210]PSV42634.1 hypothetical protein C9J46_13690 [Photobacterium sp. GB-36]PSW72510.1 hypothetical protein C9J41_16340 [Photobacterium sp. GB-50]
MMWRVLINAIKTAVISISVVSSFSTNANEPDESGDWYLSQFHQIADQQVNVVAVIEQENAKTLKQTLSDTQNAVLNEIKKGK